MRTLPPPPGSDHTPRFTTLRLAVTYRWDLCQRQKAMTWDTGWNPNLAPTALNMFTNPYLLEDNVGACPKQAAMAICEGAPPDTRGHYTDGLALQSNCPTNRHQVEDPGCLCRYYYGCALGSSALHQCILGSQNGGGGPADTPPGRNTCCDIFDVLRRWERMPSPSNTRLDSPTQLYATYTILQHRPNFLPTV